MPIVVTCPKCPTKLSAPDSAAGKAVRCPKCGAAAPVPLYIPSEEVPVIEATVAPPKPKPKAVVADAGDDDDDRPRKKSRRDEEDADDDPPRKKKKKRYDDDDDPPRRKQRNAGGGGNGGMIAVVVIVGLLVLGGVGVGIYFLTGKGSVFAKKVPLPAGWEQQNYPQDGFSVSLPAGASHTSMPTDGLQRDLGGIGGGRNPFGGGFGGERLPAAERFSQVTAGDWLKSAHAEVWVIRFRDKLPSSVRDSIRRASTNMNFGGMEIRTVKWLGYDAIEQTHPGGVTRIVYTDRHFVMASISGPNGARAKPEEEAALFDNFELTK